MNHLFIESARLLGRPLTIRVLGICYRGGRGGWFRYLTANQAGPNIRGLLLAGIEAQSLQTLGLFGRLTGFSSHPRSRHGP